MNLLDLIFPAQCGVCGHVGSGLCTTCIPAGVAVIRSLPDFDVHALSSYHATARRAIHALKDGRRDVAHAYGERLSALLEANEILVPVPTTRSRRRVRGIDGVVQIAVVAAPCVDASVLEALECVTTDHQRGKSRPERRLAFGRFRCSPIVAGMDVTLVDDVCTTGTTLEDCAAAVSAAGGRVRRAVVLASVE